MKRTQKKLSSKKIALLTALVIILALGGVASAYYFYGSTTKNSASTSKESTDGADSGDSGDSSSSNADTEGKQDFLDNQSTGNSETTPEFTSDKISIAVKETTDSIAITTKLSGFSGEGACELKVTKGAATVTQSAEVIYQAEYSTCAGFSIDKAKLDAGTWRIELTVSDKGKAYSQTSEFTIKP